MFAGSTSHRIEERGFDLLRKDLSEDALLGAARSTRHSLMHDPTREPEIYRRLLGAASVAPVCQASGVDWILLERIDAPVLWQVGDTATWVRVAGWVAGMHRRLTAAAATLGDLPLVVHDAALLADRRARATAAGLPPAVRAAHERASARLLALPATIIHGDLYPSNVLVEPSSDTDSLDVCVIDWEIAGWGPAVLDVAALTAGTGITCESRTAMARAYFDAAGHRAADWPRWLVDLDAARLDLCIQWLGWSAGWVPPEAHRHDWLAEAILLTEHQ